MLGDRAASVPPKLLCSGVAGALGLPSGGPWTGALQVEDQHTWWQQEDADKAVTEGLPGLMRGRALSQMPALSCCFQCHQCISIIT